MRIGNESITVNHTIETEGGKLPAHRAAARSPTVVLLPIPDAAAAVAPSIHSIT